MDERTIFSIIANSTAPLTTPDLYTKQSERDILLGKLSRIANSSSGDNYYIVGVLFMLSVIGLLLYVNLYHEYCFRDTLLQMMHWRFCSFLHYCFTVKRTALNNSIHNNNAVVVNEKTSDTSMKSKTYDKEKSKSESNIHIQEQAHFVPNKSIDV